MINERMKAGLKYGDYKSKVLTHRVYMPKEET